ncbi:MAG: ATP-binding cassette domain-containing protein [Puniceicoccales bacterium]|jgi:ABC-type Mn2+/Zn2+ transport system ATPase subunit|nr:ATP-binding cassette domain-containing protein [Puniceicoccales bacterium]
MAPRLDNRTLPAPAIEAVDVSVAPRGASCPVLEHITLRVPHGCRAALVGANGTGKSTLLKTLAGLLPPVEGEVRIEGAVAACGNPRVAYLAQRHLIEWHFPVMVRQAVLAGRYPHLGVFRRPCRADRGKADAALCRLGLGELASRPLHALSGGQQQRVLIARALCQEAKILLLDEPFTGLDTENRRILDDFLGNDPGRSLTVVMATHEHSDVEKRFDLVLQIKDGRIETLHSCTCATDGENG